MEARELRIGNLINIDGEPQIVTALPNGSGAFSDVFIEADYFDVHTNVEFNKVSEVQPIPLTEEWLEKFGFEGKHGEFTLNDFVVRPKTGYFEIKGYESDYSGVLLALPKYVHQLQNLYFALTEKEL